MAAALIALSLLLTAVALLRGQTPSSAREDKPLVQSHRVVKVFDFEERSQGNYEDMPRYWFPVTGPSYPRYTADQTGFDTSVYHSANHSLRMKLDGGSAALVLQTGALAAIPGADYIVIASIQTQNVVHARARISGTFFDQHGRMIDASAAASPLVVSNGHWTTVKFRLNGDYPKAAWIVLKLELLQEEEFVHPTLAKHELYRQDLGATAWFDDVSVYQLPRMDLTTDSAVNVIRAPGFPRINVLVHDLTGEKLTSIVQLYDHAGRPVDRQVRQLNGRQSPVWNWQPKIDKFGWYWAQLDVEGDSGLVGRRTAAFLYLPADPGLSLGQSQRFGLIAENMPPDLRPLLPAMTDRIGNGAVVLDVWNDQTTATELQDVRVRVDPVIDALLKRRLEVSLSLAGVPAPLAEQAKADADKPWSLLAGDPQYWRDDLKATLVRYGQQVHRWQIGTADSDELIWNPGVTSDYPDLSRWFAKLAPRAQVIAPWPAQLMARQGAAAPRYVLLNIPPTVNPDQIPAYLASGGAGGPVTDVLFQPLSLEHYDHPTREQDMAMRLIESWSAARLPRTLYLSSPWTRADSRHPAIIPDPVLGVFSCTMDRLAGRRVVAELPLQPGVRCLILENIATTSPDDTGALALWLEQSDRPKIDVAMHLGAHPVMVDLFGNRTPLPSRDSIQQFTITATPSFIEGVDVKLIRFRAAMRFQPGLIESSYKVHSVDLGFANPWDHPITGRIRLTGLPGWEIRPRVLMFTIKPNAAVVLPVEITFPISETAGEKRIPGIVELDSNSQTTIPISIPLTIGLKDIELHSSLTLVPATRPDGSPSHDDTRDIMVNMLVTNHSTTPQSLYAFATAKDRPRQERIIARLAPGQTILKKFRFADAATLSATKIRAGLRQMDGPAMLNQLLDAP